MFVLSSLIEVNLVYIDLSNASKHWSNCIEFSNNIDIVCLYSAIQTSTCLYYVLQQKKTLFALNFVMEHQYNLNIQFSDRIKW